MSKWVDNLLPFPPRPWTESNDRFLEDSGKGTPLVVKVALSASDIASTSNLDAVGTKLAAKVSRPLGFAPFGTFVA